MKTISLIAAGVLALSWTTARADTGRKTTDPSTDTDEGPPAMPETSTQPTPVEPVAPQPITTVPAPMVVPDSPTTLPPPPAVMTPAPAPETPQPTPVPATDQYRLRQPSAVSQVGAALLIGGGFEEFTNDNLKSMTSGAGTWNARAVAGTREFIGLEAAYVGAARNINTLGISSNSALVSNGVEGALRLNVPILRGLSLVEPFGFVGLGWQHYSLTNTNTNTSDVAGKDDIMTLPVGGGLEFAYGMFMADARFTYRETYYNDLLRANGGKLNNWGLGGQVGVSF